MPVKIFGDNQKYTNCDIVIIPKDISIHDFWGNNVDCPGVIGEIKLTEKEIKTITKNLLEGNQICFLGDNEHCILKKL